MQADGSAAKMHIVFAAGDLAGSDLTGALRDDSHAVATDQTSSLHVAADNLDFDQAAVDTWRTFLKHPQLRICEMLCSALRVACYTGKGIEEASKSLHDHCFLPVDRKATRVLVLRSGVAHVISNLSVHARRAVLQHADAKALAHSIASDKLQATFGQEVLLELYVNYLNGKKLGLDMRQPLSKCASAQHKVNKARFTAGADLLSVAVQALSSADQLGQVAHKTMPHAGMDTACEAYQLSVLPALLRAGLPMLHLLQAPLSDQCPSQPTLDAVWATLAQHGNHLRSLDVGKGWHSMRLPVLPALLRLDLGCQPSAHGSLCALLQANACFPELLQLAVRDTPAAEYPNPVGALCLSARNMPKLVDLSIHGYAQDSCCAADIDFASLAPQLQRVSAPCSDALRPALLCIAEKAQLRAIRLGHTSDGSYKEGSCLFRVLDALAACQANLQLVILDGMTLVTQLFEEDGLDAVMLAARLAEFAAFKQPCCHCKHTHSADPQVIVTQPERLLAMLDTSDAATVEISEEQASRIGHYHVAAHALLHLADEIMPGVRVCISNTTDRHRACKLTEGAWSKLDPAASELDAAIAAAVPQRALALNALQAHADVEPAHAAAKRKRRSAGAGAISGPDTSSTSSKHSSAAREGVQYASIALAEQSEASGQVTKKRKVHG